MHVGNPVSRAAAVGAFAVAIVTAGCSSGTSPPSTVAGGGSNSTANAQTVAQPGAQTLNGVTAPPGWHLAIWAIGSSGNYFNPDAIEVDGQNIWVGYQNNSVKDGSDNSKPSTVVEYTLDGKVVKTWPVPGHVDGLRVDPATHKAWVTSNEDGGALLNIIDPTSPTLMSITLPVTPHGGGLDDLAFVGGATYIALSNPTVDASGNNVFPAVDKITVSGSAATLVPILMGNAKATDTVAKADTTLNLTDPDCLTIDTQGELVLVSQADSALITIQNPGTANQKVLKTPIGNQEDDTVWATSSSGRLFVTDGAKNVIYTIKWSGSKGTVFTEAPNDSGVVGFVGTVDMTTGFITPIVTGMGKPTGLIYVPDAA